MVKLMLSSDEPSQVAGGIVVMLPVEDKSVSILGKAHRRQCRELAQLVEVFWEGKLNTSDEDSSAGQAELQFEVGQVGANEVARRESIAGQELSQREDRRE